MATDSPPSQTATAEAHSQRTPSDHLKEARRQFSLWRAYTGYYAAAKADQVLTSVRSVVLWAAAGLVLGLAGVAIVATGGVLLVLGIDRGLTLLFSSAWIAHLVTGALILGTVAGTTILVVKRLLSSFRLATIRKYESLKLQNGISFGQDSHANHASDFDAKSYN